MIYQLPSGRVIEITLEQYLEMSDDDIEFFIAYEVGEDLKAFNLNPNQELDGKIVVEESFIPFNPNNAERELKMAGDTGIPCLVDGQPIYRRTRYTTNLTEQDVLIQHNNTEDIREAINAAKELSLVIQ